MRPSSALDSIRSTTNLQVFPIPLKLYPAFLGMHEINLYSPNDKNRSNSLGSLQLTYEILSPPNKSSSNPPTTGFSFSTNSSPSLNTDLVPIKLRTPPQTGKKDEIVKSHLSTFHPQCIFFFRLFILFLGSIENSIFVEKKRIDNYEYTGYLYQNKKEGSGWIHYLSGKEKDEYYLGSFHENLRSGHGIYIYNDGDQYEGDWKNNLENGHGVYTFIDGDQYDGEWKDGNMNGHGIYKTNDGDQYEGEWENDEMNGHGVYKYANGEVYDGQYWKGKKSGQGQYLYNNGDEYHGEWQNDCFEGVGTYTYQKGDKYIGEWKHDMREGKGTYYSADGVIESGLWKEDRLVKQDKKYKEYY